MYPYNRNTRLYDTHTRAKEMQPDQSNLLSTDRRLEELLTLARQEAHQTARKFAALLHNTDMAEAEAILKTMYLDGMKHLRLLREVGFTIFGNTGETETPVEPEITADAPALMEELLLAEMDDINFYRSLLFAMPEEDLWNAFFEIITDKQNHTAALNHLYAKYFCKTTGN
ncbi:MAG: hypothetical protein ACI4TP_05155 [Anaerotignum sp.]